MLNLHSVLISYDVRLMVCALENLLIGGDPAKKICESSIMKGSTVIFIVGFYHAPVILQYTQKKATPRKKYAVFKTLITLLLNVVFA